MNRQFAFLFLLNTVTAFGQSALDKQKIADFKNDYLDQNPIMQHDTLHINQWTLDRVRGSWIRVVKTFEKGSDVFLEEHFYAGSTQLESSGTYTISGVPIGVTRQYEKDGTLNYTQDYDKGEWTVYNKDKYPFYDLQNKIKLKADSLVAKMYGQDVLTENLVWNISESYIYNSNLSGRWTSGFSTKPTKFVVTYNAKLGNDHIYYNVLRLNFDENGEIRPKSMDPFFDCEEEQKTWKGGFKLTYSNALLECKKLGLIESDAIKIQDDLKWENFENASEIFNQFRFYITIKTKVIEEIVPQGRSSSTTKFDRYSFDPLTGNFIEKKKLKVFRYWSGKNENVGMTGMIPDDE